MALKKNAHQLFTDREEPRQAFWNTLRKLEEDPGSSQVITYYGEGGIGKSWLLQDIRRRLERLDPENDQSVFSDGFIFRGEYIPVFYNLETSTDVIEILCQLRYSLYQIKDDLAFPLFDCAIKKYKEITGKNLVSAEDGSDSFLSKYEKYLDTAAMFIPGLGTLQSLYGYVKKGGSILNSTLAKIEDKRLRNLYSEYFEAINTSETADDIRDNIAEFFKTDLNIAERDYAIIFFIDTFELLAYNTGINTQSWLTEELAKETVNTLWVFAGRNRIYSDYDNEHLLGDLSEADTELYLREKVRITDEEVIERIYEISHGTPIFLDICVQNYRNEGNPPADRFQNLNKEQLLKRYVKYLSDGERLVIRMMASMSHWTDTDYKEVFNAVHNGSFSQYLESYNKVVRSTMIEKDNEDRYFLHRAVRTGIYEDPDYPEEIKTATRDAMLKLYDKRVEESANPVYYAARIAELTRTITDENVVLTDDQIENLAYVMIYTTLDLSVISSRDVDWYYDLMKDHIQKLGHTEISSAFISLFIADLALQAGDFEYAGSQAQEAAAVLRKTYGKGSRSTVFARRIRAMSLLPSEKYREGLALLESSLEDYCEKYPERDPNGDIATAGTIQLMNMLRLRLNKKGTDYKKALENDIAEMGWNNGMTILSAITYANSLRQEGLYNEAADVLNEAYQHVDEALFSEDYDTKIQIANLLSISSFESGMKAKAVQWAEEAVKLAAESDDSLLYYSAANANLGSLALDSSRYAEAEVYFDRAMRSMHANSDHVKPEEMAAVTRKFGDVYSLSGKYEEARKYYEAAREICEAQAVNYPLLIRGLQCLEAVCLLKTGYVEQAGQICFECLPAMLKDQRDLKKPVLDVKARMLAVLENRALPALAAEQLCTEFENYYRNVLNDENKAEVFAESTRETLNQLKMKLAIGIDAALKQKYESDLDQYGENSYETLKTLQRIMLEAYEDENYEKALDLAAKTYEIAESILSADDPLTARSLYYMMFSLHKLGREEECIEKADMLYRLTDDTDMQFSALEIKIVAEYRLKKYEDALAASQQLYTAAVTDGRKDAEDIAAHIKLESLRSLEKYEDMQSFAEELYRQRSTSYGTCDKRTVDAGLSVVSALLRQHKAGEAYERALNLYNSCKLQKDGNAVILFMLLGVASMRMERFENALSWYEKMRDAASDLNDFDNEEHASVMISKIKDRLRECDPPAHNQE